jgi:hypothetical protein
LGDAKRADEGVGECFEEAHELMVRAHANLLES